MKDVLYCFDNDTQHCDSLLGSGNFGRVYQAVCTTTWVSRPNKSFGVAIKASITPKTNKDGKHMTTDEIRSFNQQSYVDFIRESNNNYLVSNKPENNHVVKLLGIFNYKKKIFIIQELCGVDVEKYINSKFINNTPVGYDFTNAAALQIAEGMRQIHSEHIIHLDLACRNVMVQDNKGKYIFKIGDFGVSQKLEPNGFFRMRYKTTFDTNILPPRNTTTYPNTDNLNASPGFCNPNGPCKSMFSKNTDIWEYCILLYEIIIKSEFTRSKTTFAREYYNSLPTERNKVYTFGLTLQGLIGTMRLNLLKLDNPTLTADEYLKVLFGHPIRDDTTNMIQPQTKLGSIEGLPWSTIPKFESYMDMDDENAANINKLLSLLIKGYFFTDMPLLITPKLDLKYKRGEILPKVIRKFGIDINLNDLTFELITKIIKTLIDPPEVTVNPFPQLSPVVPEGPNPFSPQSHTNPVDQLPDDQLPDDQLPDAFF